MVEITIIGAGVYGSRIAEKYGNFDTIRIKAVVSRSNPKSKIFKNIPFYGSALAWKNSFGTPSNNDIFDVCVHQNVLVEVLQEFIKIGGRNFILPKPIALNEEDLLKIKKLVSKYKLNISISSQWYYSKLVKDIKKFVKEERSNISSVEIIFSRSFDKARKNFYTPVEAFLPHILQILFQTKLIKENSKPIIETFFSKKLKMKYNEKINISIESDLLAKNRTETLKIFLKSNKKPVFIADFSGVLDQGGFIEYPSITLRGKKYPVQEDPLDTMIKNHILNKKSLTFNDYIPIAKEVIKVVEQASKLVVVIGGGIFGIMSALEIAKKGYSVLILEKESQIMMGASLVNQCRVHMGYHYPRDEKTGKDSLMAGIDFNKVFSKAIVGNIKNYYLIAKEGSQTSSEDYIVFCKKMKLPYKKSWPTTMKMNRDKISNSFKVPEKIFDANTLRNILLEKIIKTPNITLVTSAEVIGIKKNDARYEIQYKNGEVTETTYVSAVINATYGNVNHINKLAGFPLEEYQYELCEEFIVKTPWGKTGWAIMDGPFFGIMPFGFSKNHIFYDVELSVLERSTGVLPKFRFDLDYYKDKKRVAERFEKYQKKWKPWVKDIEKCKLISSMYVIRIVLPKQEKTDKRPTLLKEHRPGFWQIFSGKITTSISHAANFGVIIDKFLKK